MRLGISSYAYPWAVGMPGAVPDQPLDAFMLLEKAVSLELKIVQIADNIPLDALSSDGLSALAGRARDLGITIEVGTAGLSNERLHRYLRIARSLSSDILRIVIDIAGIRPDAGEITRILRAALPDFERACVPIAIENHDRFKASELARIIGEIDSPYLGICLDTVNSFAQVEGVDLLIDVLQPWIMNVHIKDFTVRRTSNKIGFLVEGAPAGAGDLDLPGMVRRLRALPRSVSLILEQWPPFVRDISATVANEDEWARRSIECLRKTIGADDPIEVFSGSPQSAHR